MVTAKVTNQQLELMPIALQDSMPVMEPEAEPSDDDLLPVSFLITRKAYVALERKSARHQNGISGYLRDRLTYDLIRKHGGG